MKEIIKRKLEELNTRYDYYLEEYDKYGYRYQENILIELRGQIKSLEYLFDYIKENNEEIDYKTAYETSFECNKILSENYNKLDKRINKAIEYINNREEDNTTCSVCSVICSDLLSILKGGSDE